VETAASSVEIAVSLIGFALLRVDVGTRCWMIVLLTAYLKEGEPPAGDDSDIRDFRIEFCDDLLVGVWTLVVDPQNSR